jgi:hypothetical protein
MWRQLLPLAWKDAVLHRRDRLPAPRFSDLPAVQLPLDGRLRDNHAVPDLLRDEPAPWFFPSLADADAIDGAPLLAGL